MKLLTSLLASRRSKAADGEDPGPPTAPAFDDTDGNESPSLVSEAATANSIVQSVLEGLGLPIFVVDAEGYFLKLNDEALELFHREPGEIVGDCIFDYDEADNSVMRNVLDTGEPARNLDGEVVVDGETVPVVRNVMPFFDEAGNVVGALEINQDVSETVELERRERILEEYQSTVLAELDDAIADLSRGDFTIDPAVPEPTADFPAIRNVHAEFAEMAENLRYAVENTRSVLREASDRSTELEQISREMAEASDHARTVIGEITESSENVTSVAEAQTSRTDSAEEHVSELSASIEEITATTQQIDELAADAARLAGEGSIEAQTAISRMEGAIDASARNVRTVASLEDQMETVDEMTEMIDQIADQTNLLALNANIEAARAGAEGAGFKVVADEVKALAEESKETVAEITEIVGNLQEGIAETTETITESSDEIEQSADAVRAVVQRIDDIEEAASETSDGLAEIANATEDQATSAATVHHLVEEVAAGSRDVDEQMTTVSAGIGQQAQTIETVADASGDVSHVAVEMAGDLRHFRLTKEQVATLHERAMGGGNTDHATDGGNTDHATDGGNDEPAIDGGNTDHATK